MRAYWAILSARFRTLLQYRAAAAAGFGTQLFWGLIKVMIFYAFYHSTAVRQPMAYKDVVTYVWLGQAMLMMLPWNVERDLREMIRWGAVAYELLRPLDLYSLWYSRALAWRTAPTARGPPRRASLPGVGGARGGGGLPGRDPPDLQDRGPPLPLDGELTSRPSHGELAGEPKIS